MYFNIALHTNAEHVLWVSDSGEAKMRKNDETSLRKRKSIPQGRRALSNAETFCFPEVFTRYESKLKKEKIWLSESGGSKIIKV